jgi:uncharacterized RDD family membrane protein YckC
MESDDNNIYKAPKASLDADSSKGDAEATADNPKTRYNTVVRRVFAYLIDVLLLMPVVALSRGLLGTSTILGSILGFLLAWGPVIYFVVLHAKYGQTAGKRVCNIKLLRFDETGHCNWLQAAIRELVPVLILSLPYLVVPKGSTFAAMFLIPVIWYGLNGLAVFVSQKKRSLYDLVGYTVVVQYNLTDKDFQNKKTERNFPG